MRKRYITIITLLTAAVFFISKSWGQDPVFSQYYISPMHINPAFAGNTGGINFTLNSRLQWPGLPGAYSTFAASYDQFFPDQNSGIGLRLITDSAGDGAMTSTKVGGVYSYNLKISEGKFIRGGLELGFVQTALNWNRFIFLDAIEASGGIRTPGGGFLPSSEQVPGELSKTYLDISSGAIYYNKSFYFGLAVAHLNTPNNSFLRNVGNNYVGLPLLFSLQTGVEISLDNNNKSKSNSFISPNLLVLRQAGFHQINGGAYIQIDKIFGGLWYRHTIENGDAVIFNFGVRQGNLKIGYSFDFTVSELGISTGGSHELGMVINIFDEASKKTDHRDCLRLFR
jgi:type IX secretion system PorP/SprF family membrane protein